MKKRLSLSEKIDLGIAEIFFLANQINRKTDMCCFCHDMGHIQKIELKITKSKEEYNDQPAIFELSYDVSEKYRCDIDSDKRLMEIDRCKSFLIKTLKEKEIAYGYTNEIKEYVTVGWEI